MAMALVKINPMVLPGPWVEGFVLDYHTAAAHRLGIRINLGMF
jgi:hypothetical protein